MPWPDPGPEAIDVPDGRRWNHNVQYTPIILDAIPAGAERALDVGCGEGIVARALRNRVPNVVGIDLDEQSIELARQQGPDDIEYVLGDAIRHPFEPRSFDVIGSVTALHHMVAADALHRLVALLRPGGVLAIVGVARRRLPHDVPWEIAGAVWTRLLHLTRDEWTTCSPKTWPPPHTFAQMRKIAADALPGVRWRHHALWRYSLVWTKPTS